MFLVERGRNTREIDPNPGPGPIEDILDLKATVDHALEGEEILNIDLDHKINHF